MTTARVRILHCHSTFAAGGKERRAVRLMNEFGDHARHVVLSAEPDELGAQALIDPDVDVEFPADGPALSGRPTLARYRSIARAMRDHDLVLTYNWGAMDAVMARRMFPQGLPPLVHHEDGFNADEATRLRPERTLFRRLALPAANAVVVPSMTLETIARTQWRRSDVTRIANGVDLIALQGPPRPIPGLDRAKAKLVIGTFAGLRPVKALPMLVRAVAGLPGATLVIAGEGPERSAIIAEAERCGMSDRLVMPGTLDEAAGHIRMFDIFALSSASEQAPLSLMEAMAAGLPVVATDVGDVRAMVAEANQPFIVQSGADGAFYKALQVLASDIRLRQALGAANRKKALAAFGEDRMITAYGRLYEQVLGRPGALGRF